MKPGNLEGGFWGDLQALKILVQADWLAIAAINRSTQHDVLEEVA